MWTLGSQARTPAQVCDGDWGAREKERKLAFGAAAASVPGAEAARAQEMCASLRPLGVRDGAQAARIRSSQKTGLCSTLQAEAGALQCGGPVITV